MAKRLPLLVLVALLLAGCGGGGRSAQTTTPTTVAATSGPQATPTGPPLTVVAYFYKNGRLAPVSVEVPRTRGVANAALHALLEGPPDPTAYDTALTGVEDARVTTVAEDGTATVRLPKVLTRRAKAQVVYTLTRVPRVTAVAGMGTRSDYQDLVSLILVESPLPHDQVATPIEVRGTASVYEATLVIELVQNGQVVVKQAVTAAEGAPYRGEFDTTLPGGEAGPATIVAWAPNAAGGPPQHRVEVPVEITP